MQIITPITELDGKKLSKSQVNMLTTLSKLGVSMPEQSETRSNRYSGVSHLLTPLQVAVFDFIMETYGNYQRTYQLAYRGQKVTQTTFDQARYFFLNWSNLYYDLID